MGKRFILLSLQVCLLTSMIFLPKSGLCKFNLSKTDSVYINQDSTNINPPNSKNHIKIPHTKTPNIDTTKRFYKFLPQSLPFKADNLIMAIDDREHFYHRHIEDYFSQRAHIYNYDKMEYGQFNDLNFGGLGAQYQLVWLDDVLLNDPFSMRAQYQMLSSESFSSLSFAQGVQALSISPYPLSLYSVTQKMVAAKGYTKISYFQFIEDNLKADITFSLNFSERLNFYANYVRESTDGRYNNVNGSGVDRYASGYEGNKFNIQFRYQLGQNDYLTFSDYLFLLQQKPFGGVDYITSINVDLDPLDPLSAVVENLFTERYTFNHTIKTEYETTLPFLPDSLNQFNIWLAYSSFKHEYTKNILSVLDSTLINDLETASRYTLGASQNLDFNFWSLNLRGLTTLDRIYEQNTLINNDSTLIRPTVSRIWLNAYSALTLNNLIENFPIKAYGSVALSRESITETLGQDHNNTHLGFGVGGTLIMPFRFYEASDPLNLFFNLSSTVREPSLIEVFSSTDITGKQNWETEDLYHFDIGTEIKLSENTSFKLLYLYNRVESPLVVIQTINADSTISQAYQNLNSEALTYSGIGFESKFSFWKFSSIINYTGVLNYEILNNADRSYHTGISTSLSEYDNASSDQIFYLPKHRLSISLFFNDSFFDEALKLKAGFTGYMMSPLSAGLQNSERQQILYFNLINQEGALRDNNLQYGVQDYTTQLDFKLWADIGSAVVFVFFENLLDNNYFTTPFYYSNPFAFRLGFTWLIID